MKLFRYIQSIIAVFNIVFALLFIMAAFSDSVSPNKSISFAYLGLLFPFFLLANLCFAFYWLIIRKWKFFVVPVFAMFICWQPIKSYIPINFCTSNDLSANNLKILTYNVMGFGYQKHSKTKPNPIIEYIINSNADIVCLQEYLVGKSSENFLSHEEVNRALHMYPFHYHLPLVNYAKYSMGLAVFSKYPILNSWKVRYDSSFNGSTVHEIDVNGRKMIVVNNHLESFKLTMEDRSKYLDFIKNINSDTFDGLRETLQRKLGAAYLIRAEQAEIIAEEIHKLQGDYMVICGDFNDTPISYAHRTIKGALIDAFEESGTGIGITYHQNFFWFRIDHIMHSKNMKSNKTQIDKIAFSDHYPMWSYLELK